MAANHRYNHRYMALCLGQASKDLLLQHIDGPNFVDVKVMVREQIAPRNALLHRHLIRYSRSSARPTSTILTEDGRFVLAFVLAGYAEALIRAGYSIEAEVACAVRDDAIVLFEQHAKDFPPPLAQSDASPSTAEASGLAQISQSPQQTVCSAGD